MSKWDLKEPKRYSKRVGRQVPSVVAVFLSSKCGGLGGDVLKRLVVYMRPRTQKQPQVKKELCRVLDNVK